MRHIIEELADGQRPPVVLHLPSPRDGGGFHHGDLMAVAVDRGQRVYRVSYEFADVECDGWFPAEWVWRPGHHDGEAVARLRLVTPR